MKRERKPKIARSAEQNVKAIKRICLWWIQITKEPSRQKYGTAVRRATCHSTNEHSQHPHTHTHIHNDHSIFLQQLNCSINRKSTKISLRFAKLSQYPKINFTCFSHHFAICHFVCLRPSNSRTSLDSVCILLFSICLCCFLAYSPHFSASRIHLRLRMRRMFCCCILGIYRSMI